MLPALVHVVDDDDSFRTAIGRRLRAAGYGVVTYKSAERFLERMPEDVRPGCILLDVRIPGLSGPELQDRLTRIGSILPIVFLTGHADTPTTVQAIKAGAEDFLTKPVSGSDLLGAVERAIARHHAAQQQRVSSDELQALIARLTPREREVFELVVRGRMNKQIAYELGATERTIKAHRQRVMEKIRVQSLAELVSVAEHAGILTPGAGVREIEQPRSK